MTGDPLFGPSELLPLLPHRPPFLFVDRVMAIEAYKSITAERSMRPEEPFFAGHFPGHPIMPGVLVAEALAQTCGLLLGLSDYVSGDRTARPRMFHLAATKLKFTSPAVPGDILVLNSTCQKSLSGLHSFNVEARVRGNIVACGSLALAEVNP